MAIIEFTPKDSKQVSLAKFFADQEMNDFKEMLELFINQCQISYLFKDIDFNSIQEATMEYVYQKHFDKNGNLKPNSIKEINQLYSERFDIDEFYEDFIKKD